MSGAAGLPRSAVWIALAALILGLCLARVSSVHLEDDNLYLIYASQPVTLSSMILADEITQAVATQPGCDLEQWRLAFRERYKSNYAAYTGTQGAIQSSFLWTGLSVPIAMVAALLATKALYLLVGLGALVIVAMRPARSELPLAVIIALLLLALFDLLAQRMTTFWIVDIERPLRAIMQLGYSSVFAHAAHSIFGLTPRNVALAGFALAFLLKWQGRTATAGWVVLAIGVLHQTYGGLALAFLSLATALSTPAAFGRWSPRIPLVLAAVMYVMREQYWGGSTAFGMQALIVLGVVVAAQVAFMIVGSRAYQELRVELLGSWAEHDVGLDAALLVLLPMLATVICLVGGGAASDPVRRLYFWSDLAIRIWSLVRVPVLIALMFYVVRRFGLVAPPRMSMAYGSAAAVAAVLTLFALMQVDTGAWSRMERQLAKLESPPTAPVLRPIDEEARIYYLLASVAAGTLDATTATERIYVGRPIHCRGTGTDGHETVTSGD